MAGNILGEGNSFSPVSKNGFTGVDLSSGAFVGFRNVKRSTQHTGSGPGSAEFAATDPRRIDGPNRDTGNATPNAEPVVEAPASVENVKVENNNTVSPVNDETDLRTIIKPPSEYITGEFSNIFSNHGGVLFPYSSQITLESKAEYSQSNPLHSNYPINFYKNSSVSDISITSSFTVQNVEDAYYYLGSVRILTALTKMRFGKDPLAGSPPPICRLFAYGEWVLKNVPVVILSVKHDLPDDVDFYTTKIRGHNVSVPTKATVTVSCRPTYSRQEMSVATVNSYLNNSLAGKGYL